MFVWLSLSYDFCGFRSVAVNSVYKLQFFTFIYEYLQSLIRIFHIWNILILCHNSNRMKQDRTDGDDTIGFATLPTAILLDKDVEN